MNRPQQQESHRYTSASNERADAAVSPRVVTDNEGVEPAVLVLKEPLHPVERRRSSNISFERHMLGFDDVALGLLMDLDDDDDTTTEASTVDFDEDDLLDTEDEEDFGTFFSRFVGEEEEQQVLRERRETDTTARPSAAIIPSSFFLGTTAAQPRQERTRVDNAVLDSVQSHNNQFHDSTSMISKTEDEIIAKAVACGKLLDEQGTADRSSLFGTAGSSFRRHYFARPPADNDDASSRGDENSKCVSATDSRKAAAPSRIQDDILAALQELNKLGCNDQEEGNKGTSSSGDVKATIIKKADNKDGPSSKMGSSPLQNLPGCENEREEGALAMAGKMAQVSAPPPRLTMLDP